MKLPNSATASKDFEIVGREHHAAVAGVQPLHRFALLPRAGMRRKRRELKAETFVACRRVAEIADGHAHMIDVIDIRHGHTLLAMGHQIAATGPQRAAHPYLYMVQSYKSRLEGEWRNSGARVQSG